MKKASVFTLKRWKFVLILLASAVAIPILFALGRELYVFISVLICGVVVSAKGLEANIKGHKDKIDGFSSIETKHKENIKSMENKIEEVKNNSMSDSDILNAVNKSRGSKTK